MTTYRYLLADVATTTVQAELDFTGVNFTQALNSAGTFSGQILLTGVSDDSNAFNATTPGLMGLYVERNGVIVWGGVIWGRSYSSSSQQLSITAREWESYFERRRIASTLLYFNKDLLTVANQLISAAQSVPSGNVGVRVGTALSGINVVRTYYAYELKTYLAALQDLAKSGTGANGQSGFDFAIDCAYDGAKNIIKTLNLGYPRIGNALVTTTLTAGVSVGAQSLSVASATGLNDGVTLQIVDGGYTETVTIDATYNVGSTTVPLVTGVVNAHASGTTVKSGSATAPVFELPGNIVEYEYPEDGSQVANRVYATGAGSNEGKLVYQASDTTKLSQGWALLEDAVSYSDIIDAKMVQNLASAHVAAVAYPPVVLKIVVSPFNDPVLGSYRVGDDARIRITDPRFPNGLDTVYRITGLTITPGETGPERATLTLTLPTA